MAWDAFAFQLFVSGESQLSKQAPKLTGEQSKLQEIFNFKDKDIFSRVAR
jgi:hypothetical protein